MRLDVDESRSLELPAEDTLRQGTSYSAGPGIGIGHNFGGQLFVEDDVRE